MNSWTQSSQTCPKFFQRFPIFWSIKIQLNVPQPASETKPQVTTYKL